MLKDIAKNYYFEHNYNCAECMLHAANDYYHLNLDEHAMKMVAAQGAGFQCMQMCGALNVCGCILSLLFVEERAHESKMIQKVTVQTLNAFKEKLGSTQCAELRKMYFKQEFRCLHTVEAACDCLEEVVNQYKDEIVL